ncbi:MAG: [protein-PII] uridylyltransferase [Desulfobacula sp.]|uniref:[protein-PII] uridylyltransferase n=1 Tax=Desulfobacula sp. TaxID=2593537 RepID=UPI001D6E9312|nr:[protein-PII] uridylyltransferase [Desulfobacula sp.]MBT3804649.1 [protein-PII] uridylyltransferase [Desulfobacula sp.]MBT4023999.1 [protein-PII] uridylyltransferase [Desulfobacula sp.]MBT4198361.1 [protein-PII] uridylyltransferase [Desulfobacula sp.]MBT4506099.1 [protein-PII] uridylyltransferase [Desulfobacula sp.]
MDKKNTDIFIKKREALIGQFLSGDGSGFLEKHTSVLDEYFLTVFEKSITARKMTMAGSPFAIIALGGYGRKEQCIHSDIDLLILFEKKIPPEVEAFLQELLYPLWDARFEVGYAVRNVTECLEMAFERFDILTTILDARFICGASLIYTAFMEKFRSDLDAKHLKHTLNYLYEHGEKRHFDFGDSTYLIAPDLKSGFGGLRDYHTLLWYAKIKSGIKTRRDLEYYGFLSHFEYLSLTESLTDIWKIRNFLHSITKRKCDTLYFEYQTELAGLLGYRTKNRQPDVEGFLGDLHKRLDFLKQINQITFEDILGSTRIGKGTSEFRLTKIDGLVVKKRRLYFANTVAVLQKPDLLLKIFLESGLRKIPLSIEARRIVSEFLHLVDSKIKKDPDCIRIFKKIMSQSYWEFNVLNVMLATGILEKLIPEFSALVNKIQYNHYHLFPVDKHCIRCVQVINSYKDFKGSPTKSLYYSVFREVRNKNILFFTALLHDIGKSDPAKEHSKTGAKIAKPIFKRFGFNSTEVNDGVFLIENHLIFIKTATRRDISDEETAVYMAHKIGKIRLLRMLYLLTVADSQATGPKAWNEWTENLLKDLFLKTMGIFKKGELASKKSQRIIDKRKKNVLRLLKKTWSENEINAQLESMPKRYLVNVPAQSIVCHINLYRNLKGKDFIWRISKENNSDIRTVSICGKDKPGFYSKIAGVFFLNNLDIVASQAYSFGEEHVIDIFKVKPPKDKIFEKEKWEKAQKDLVHAINDDHFLDNALVKIPRSIQVSSGKNPRPNTIRIDNETSSFFTIIEVFTYDFAGLLFAITNALYRSQLNVDVAMVATKVDQVVDVFYVKSLENGSKIENEQGLSLVKNKILKSLPHITKKGDE